MNEFRPTLIACHECDLLQKEVTLAPGMSALCRRCGAVLYRNSPDSLDRTLALTMAAAMLFMVANIYPIMGIDMRGNQNATNLIGAVNALWDQHMHLISTLVFATTILIPSLELSMLLFLLLPLKLGLKPHGIAFTLRVLQNIKPWGMVEVFMLGVLVALVKLTDTSKIIPGVALWSFGGLTLLMAAVTASFNPRDIWERLDWTSVEEEKV